MKFTVDSVSFRKALKNVSNALSKDDNRPLLKGIHLRLVGDHLTLTALDGYVMLEQTIVVNYIPHEPGTTEDGECTIEPRMFIKTIDKVSGPLACELQDEFLSVITKDYVLKVRTIPGEYVHSDKLWPTDERCEITFDARKLMQVLKGLEGYGIGHQITLAIPNTPISPLMIRDRTTDMECSKALVLPIRAVGAGDQYQTDYPKASYAAAIEPTEITGGENNDL